MTDEFKLFTSMRFDWALASTPAEIPRDVGWNSKTASPFYMLDFHRDRMLRSAEFWGWTHAVDTIKGDDGLARLREFLKDSLQQAGKWEGPEQQEPLRLKILLAQDGHLSLEFSPVPKASLHNLFPEQLPPPDSKSGLEPLPVYDVYLDSATTSPSEFTHYKTTRREVYDSARERLGIKPTDVTKEVLIVDGETDVIMEGSLTTPYFWRGGRWVTPPVSDNCCSNGEAWTGYGGQAGTTRRWSLARFLVLQGAVKASEIEDGEAVWLSNGVRGFVFGRIRLS